MEPGNVEFVMEPVLLDMIIINFVSVTADEEHPSFFNVGIFIILQGGILHSCSVYLVTADVFHPPFFTTGIF